MVFNKGILFHSGEEWHYMGCKLRTGTCQQDGWSSVLLTDWYVIIRPLCELNNQVRLVMSRFEVAGPLLHVCLLL